jgi:pimeloyl-ACP methyl ester carboxylesterase
MAAFTTPDGISLYYEAHGLANERAVIVLLNGITQTTANWALHVRRFKENFGVVTYDARGQGRSPLGALALSLAQHESDLAALLAHLNLSRVHLVGMSLGARVALAAARRRPRQVGRLVLCSAAAAPCEPGAAMVRSWREILKTGGMDAMAWAMLPVVFGKSFLSDYAPLHDKIVKALAWRNSGQAVEAQLSALSDYPKNAEMARNSGIATLVISGDEDLLVPPHSARELADRCGGRHLILERVGHSVPAEAPELFSRTVVEFLTAPPSAATGLGSKQPNRPGGDDKPD